MSKIDLTVSGLLADGFEQSSDARFVDVFVEVKSRFQFAPIL